MRPYIAVGRVSVYLRCINNLGMRVPGRTSGLCIYASPPYTQSLCLYLSLIEMCVILPAHPSIYSHVWLQYLFRIQLWGLAFLSPLGLLQATPRCLAPSVCQALRVCVSGKTYIYVCISMTNSTCLCVRQNIHMYIYDKLHVSVCLPQHVSMSNSTAWRLMCHYGNL